MRDEDSASPYTRVPKRRIKHQLGTGARGSSNLAKLTVRFVLWRSTQVRFAREACGPRDQEQEVSLRRRRYMSHNRQCHGSGVVGRWSWGSGVE